MNDPTLDIVKAEIGNVEHRRRKVADDLVALRAILRECDKELYELRSKELHIKEIYRLAKIHFPRLRRQEGDINPKDVAELEKWIRRAKSIDGLKAIVDALTEIEKYQPSDIKSNFYALVQRIIIGGSYKDKKKK